MSDYDPQEHEVRYRFDLDLGSSHWLKFHGWHPDQDLNPQYEEPGVPYPAVEKAGALIGHLTVKTESGYCEGAITFDLPEMKWHTGPKWAVEKWDPLTLSPSILCKAPTPSGPCDDHGFIREGKWVAA